MNRLVLILVLLSLAFVIPATAQQSEIPSPRVGVVQCYNGDRIDWADDARAIQKPEKLADGYVLIRNGPPDSDTPGRVFTNMKCLWRKPARPIRVMQPYNQFVRCYANELVAWQGTFLTTRKDPVTGWAMYRLADSWLVTNLDCLYAIGRN